MEDQEALKSAVQSNKVRNGASCFERFAAKRAYYKSLVVIAAAFSAHRYCHILPRVAEDGYHSCW